MIIDNIKDKYVICSFGIDSHKLVKVKSETKAKFTFVIDCGRELGFETIYTQMKNTIIAVGTKESLQEVFNKINEQEKIINDARKTRLSYILSLNG